jgi:hypothetical protein
MNSSTLLSKVNNWGRAVIVCILMIGAMSIFSWLGIFVDLRPIGLDMYAIMITEGVCGIYLNPQVPQWPVLFGVKKPDLSIFLSVSAYLPETSYFENGWRKTIPLFGFAFYLLAIGSAFKLFVHKLKNGKSSES